MSEFIKAIECHNKLVSDAVCEKLREAAIIAGTNSKTQWYELIMSVHWQIHDQYNFSLSRDGSTVTITLHGKPLPQCSVITGLPQPISKETK